MVKLSRIIKKIVGNVDGVKSQGQNTKPVIESFASRGKSQPTIDFSNLPSFDSLKSEREKTEKEIPIKKLKKVIKSDAIVKIKPKSIQKKHKDYKSKVLGKSSVDIPSISKTITPIAPQPASSHENRIAQNKDVQKIKEKLKVIKTNSSLSRGKRKREQKKEACRRKNEFKNEAIKILKQNRKEDKHGKPLGNLNQMIHELESIEDSIRSSAQLGESPRKNKGKLTSKLIKRTKRVFDIATNNV